MQRGVFVETVWIILLSFFAAYGIVQLMVRMMLFARKRNCEEAFSYRVLVLKNCQETVEGLIRSMAWEDIRDDLIVVDLGSEDETPEILERLERELDFLYVMTPEEYQEYSLESIGYTD